MGPARARASHRRAPRPGSRRAASNSSRAASLFTLPCTGSTTGTAALCCRAGQSAWRETTLGRQRGPAGGAADEKRIGSDDDPARRPHRRAVRRNGHCLVDAEYRTPRQDLCRRDRPRPADAGGAREEPPVLPARPSRRRSRSDAAAPPAGRAPASRTRPAVPDRRPTERRPTPSHRKRFAPHGPR